MRPHSIRGIALHSAGVVAQLDANQSRHRRDYVVHDTVTAAFVWNPQVATKPETGGPEPFTDGTPATQEFLGSRKRYQYSNHAETRKQRPR
jgi:hypothetical protein